MRLPCPPIATGAIYYLLQLNFYFCAMIYQIHITLSGSRPKIWRRILVKPDTLLSDLHNILQTTMGWTNSHLHQFIAGKVFYTPSHDLLWEEGGETDYEGVVLSDLLKEPGDKMHYEYDFGDGWHHVLLLESTIKPVKGEFYPQCTGGALNCPPEDCGGIPGFMNLLDAISDPHHPEHQEYKEWLEGDFDPAHFSPAEVNNALKL